MKMDVQVSPLPKVQNNDGTAETELHRFVSPSNIGEIFTYQYDDQDASRFGAKAVAFVDIDDEIDIFFFSQGCARVGNNVHHRDVLSRIIELRTEAPEFESLRKVLEVVVNLRPMQAPEIYEAAEKHFEGRSDVCRRFVDDVVKDAVWDSVFVPLLEIPERFEEFAAAVKRRANRELEDFFMFDAIFLAQGYQFTATQTAKGLIIESAEMDSAITSLQKRHPAKVKPELYAAMSAKVLSRISPEVTTVRNIETPTELLLVS